MKPAPVFFIAVLLSASFTAVAQTKGWELGGSATFGTTFGILSGNKPQGLVPNTDPAPVLQFSTGVFARKFFKNRFGMEFGAQFSSFGLRRSSRVIVVDANGLPQGGMSFNNKRSYTYIEMPIRFVYKQNAGKVELGGFAGLSPALLLAARETNSNNGGPGGGSKTESAKNKTRPFNLFVDLGFLFRTNVYKSLYFEAKPILRISTAPHQKIPQYPNTTEIMMSMGANLAVTWQF